MTPQHVMVDLHRMSRCKDLAHHKVCCRARRRSFTSSPRWKQQRPSFPGKWQLHSDSAGMLWPQQTCLQVSLSSVSQGEQTTLAAQQLSVLSLAACPYEPAVVTDYS